MAVKYDESKLLKQYQKERHELKKNESKRGGK